MFTKLFSEAESTNNEESSSHFEEDHATEPGLIQGDSPAGLQSV